MNVDKTGFETWPSYSAEEAQAVYDVILSNKVNYWTGDIGRQFEKEFASWTGVKHAVAVSNGTLALDLALQALDVGAGDEVIVTPRSFIASVSSVVNAGATPVFSDVEKDSGNISPASIAAVVTERTKAVIPVHLAGWPCDMHGIMELAEHHGFKVIEDCAQAHGASIRGQRVGSFGHIGAWSFCQDKIMTTGGEGGMVTTNDPDLWSNMWSYKDHGKDFDAVYNIDHPPGFRWLHNSFGTNWRMLEMQAAIGRIQLKKMAEWTDRRTSVAQALRKVLSEFPDLFYVPAPPSDYAHAYYRFYAYWRPSDLSLKLDRDGFVNALSSQGYPAFQGTCSEIYLEKAFDGTQLRPEEPLPNAKALGENSIMFLTHPNISEENIEKYCNEIRTICSGLTK
jgi:dTDP-4-amino-4,6-dideoxygalactose transaminase